MTVVKSIYNQRCRSGHISHGIGHTMVEAKMENTGSLDEGHAVIRALMMSVWPFSAFVRWCGAVVYQRQSLNSIICLILVKTRTSHTFTPPIAESRLWALEVYIIQYVYYTGLKYIVDFLDMYVHETMGIRSMGYVHTSKQYLYSLDEITKYILC